MAHIRVLECNINHDTDEVWFTITPAPEDCVKPLPAMTFKALYTQKTHGHEIWFYTMGGSPLINFFKDKSALEQDLAYIGSELLDLAHFSIDTDPDN